MVHCRIRNKKLSGLGAPLGRSPHATKASRSAAGCMVLGSWTGQDEHLQALSELAVKYSTNVTAEHVQKVGRGSRGDSYFQDMSWEGKSLQGEGSKKDAGKSEEVIAAIDLHCNGEVWLPL